MTRTLSSDLSLSVLLLSVRRTPTFISTEAKVYKAAEHEGYYEKSCGGEDLHRVRIDPWAVEFKSISSFPRGANPTFIEKLSDVAGAVGKLLKKRILQHR